eukprot:4905544-Pyramimonas_sp.AAC.1
MIKEDLDDTLSVDKYSLVSSSVALGRNILNALGSWAGKYNQSTTYLGSDFRAGKPVSLANKSKRARRMRKVRPRAARLRQLVRVAGQGARKIVTCGILPAGAHASEIEGLSNNYLEQLRNIELSASGPECKGKSRAVTFAVYGCKSDKWALGPVT